MNVENAIRSFANAGHDLPRDAMRWTLDNWDDAAPGLLEALERFANGTDRSKKAANATFFILHLAGERRETRAFAPLCRLAREAEAAEAVLGDGITSTLKRILISTYDGNLDALKGVIEAARTDEFVRIGALEALAYLMATEHIAREEAEAYLLRLSMVALLGLEPWSDVVRQAFARGLISPMDMNDDNFQEDLILALVTLDGWCWPRGLELRGERLSGLPTAGMNDPADLFETPDAVVRHPALTREQKVQILNNWQLDASRLEGSEGEGMRGEDAPMLHRVRIALAALMGQR
jgi:hypothetical protein